MSDAALGWRPALVWGLVGGLSFLVFLQGYELLTPERVSPLVKGAVAVFVTVGATVLVRVAAPWLRKRVS